jgi:hypothetical protein
MAIFRLLATNVLDAKDLEKVITDRPSGGR